MKRIGTVASSAGLIFLGVWMIINKNNSALGKEVLKWWPVIIIILGIEILVHFSSNRESKPGFNGLIIPIVIIYILINMFQGVAARLGRMDFPFNFDNIRDYTDEFRVDRYKTFTTEKILQIYGNKIYLTADNGSVNLHKSDKQEIKINAKAFIVKSSPATEFEINEVKEKDGYKFDFNNSIIGNIQVDLYIPDNFEIIIDGRNLRIKADEGLNLSAANISLNNGNLELSNSQALKLEMGNGRVRLRDVKNIGILGTNCSIDIDGKCEVIDVDTKNGKIDIDNDVTKSMNIKVDTGSVDINTMEKDVNLQIDIDTGALRANGEKVFNSSLKRSYGKGSNSVKINVNQGAVNFSSQE